MRLLNLWSTFDSHGKLQESVAPIPPDEAANVCCYCRGSLLLRLLSEYFPEVNDFLSPTKADLLKFELDLFRQWLLYEMTLMSSLEF